MTEEEEHIVPQADPYHPDEDSQRIVKLSLSLAIVCLIGLIIAVVFLFLISTYARDMEANGDLAKLQITQLQQEKDGLTKKNELLTNSLVAATFEANRPKPEPECPPAPTCPPMSLTDEYQKAVDECRQQLDASDATYKAAVEAEEAALKEVYKQRVDQEPRDTWVQRPEAREAVIALYTRAEEVINIAEHLRGLMYECGNRVREVGVRTEAFQSLKLDWGPYSEQQRRAFDLKYQFLGQDVGDLVMCAWMRDWFGDRFCPRQECTPDCCEG
jgi:hypothetical protein